tara:strand:- start:420 stop:584 length:165 start_codon:yes stop_codon:yes gene_type:complete
MPAFTNIIPKALALLIIYGQGAVIAPCAENTPPEKIYIIGYTEDPEFMKEAGRL